MKILSNSHIRKNMWSLSYSLKGIESDDHNLKRDFLTTLNSIQKVRFDFEDIPKMNFRNNDLVSGLIRAKTITESDVAKNYFLVDIEHQMEIQQEYEKALELIKSLDLGLYRAIVTLVNSIFCCNVDNSSGGSVTCYISLIWISPKLNWTYVDYAETLVHEFVHNSLFLDDMINNVFPKPDQLSSVDAMVTSAILKRKRHFDKSFHSACVAIGLMYFYHLLDDFNKLALLYNPLILTVQELVDKDKYRQSIGLPILSLYGREILHSMNRFIQAPNLYYENISYLLNN